MKERESEGKGREKGTTSSSRIIKSSHYSRLAPLLCSFSPTEISCQQAFLQTESNNRIFKFTLPAPTDRRIETNYKSNCQSFLFLQSTASNAVSQSVPSNENATVTLHMI